MFKKAVLIILISAFILPVTTEASYFTILLKNGNDIDVSNYWDSGSKIRFYTDEGRVEIPKLIIRNISTAKGTLETDVGFYPTDNYFDQLEEKRSREELLATGPEEILAPRDSEIKSDIEDRLSIMDINIENLNKNKAIYTTQKQELLDKKSKYDKRIEEWRKDTYTDPDITGKKIYSLTDNINQVEEKIETIDQKIDQTENLLEKQKSMRKRLEKQLAGIR